MSCFEWCHAFDFAETDAIVLSEVAVDGLEGVVGLASNDRGFFPFEESLSADDAFVCGSGTDVVDGGTTRDDLAGFAFMGSEGGGNVAVGSADQFSQIAVGKQSALIVGLFAESKRFGEQLGTTTGSRDSVINILRRREVEDDRDEVGVGSALMTSWRVVDADCQPQDLAVGDVLTGSKVFGKDLKDQVGTKPLYSWTADPRKLLLNPVGEGVF